MMELVMANSGAAKAVLLLMQGEEWFVQALGDITTEKHEMLLTVEASQRTASLISEFENAGDQDSTEKLRTHLYLLEQCREQGIDAAFDQLRQQPDSD